MSVIDTHGRRINYLRLSITDRCNLRCTYCMPAKGFRRLPDADVLTYEELHAVAQAAVEIGVEKIRITGGEPLVRKGVAGFLARLRQIPGLKKLVLTTNGLLLDEMAEELKRAGVESINISLDSMQPEVFSRITRLGDLGKVMAGLRAAERVGFRHLKINMVVMRGINDQEVLDFAALTLEKPITVRFIEYMPTAGQRGWRSLMVGGDELLSRLSNRFTLEKLESDVLDGPAANYRIEGAAGRVGFITPISCHFCQACNRIRVTSSGTVKGCLFEEGTADLRPYLASGDDVGLKEALRRAAWRKPLRHGLQAGGGREGSRLRMSQVGG
jgi:cyclic pyranopterin phosphate synthase